jgi:hypothetical protein
LNQRFNDNNIDFKKRKLTKYIKKEEEFFNFEDSSSIKILKSLILWSYTKKEFI